MASEMRQTFRFVIKGSTRFPTYISAGFKMFSGCNFHPYLHIVSKNWWCYSCFQIAGSQPPTSSDRKVCIDSKSCPQVTVWIRWLQTVCFILLPYHRRFILLCETSEVSHFRVWNSGAWEMLNPGFLWPQSLPVFFERWRTWMSQEVSKWLVTGL